MERESFDVVHLAQLARMNLSAEEQERFGRELEHILGYVDQLQEVNVDGVEETAQVTGLVNVLRDDVVRTGACDRDELLAAVPELHDGMVKIPAIFEER